MTYKAINERLENIANTLGTEHQLYKSYKSLLTALNVDFTEKLNKNGLYVAKIKSTTTQENINKISKKPTLKIHLQNVKTNLKNKKIETLKEQGYSKKQIKELSKVSQEEVIEESKKNSDIKNFIEEHKDDIYKIQELNEAVHRQTKLTEEEVEKLFNLYETDYSDYIPQELTEEYD